MTDADFKEGTHFDTSSDPITMSKEVALLKNDNIVTSVVAPTGYMSVYQSLFTTTGGIFSEISNAFSGNLNALASMINTNSAPSLTVLSPLANQWAGRTVSDLVPKISVSDPDGDALICTYYVDSETAPRDTRTITNTATAQEATFNALSLAGLADGVHTLKVQITDQWAAPIVKTVTFQVDQTAPTVGTISASSTENSIVAQASATDSGSGMAALPYRYTLNSTLSPWTASSYTFTGLSPNTLYTVKAEAKDNLDHIGGKQQNVYTKAQTPAFTLSNATETSLRINLADSNPSTTLYQFKVGSMYVDAAGNLTSSTVSVTPSGRQLTINGLASNTEISVTATAINGEGVASAWSSAVKGTTAAMPPANLQVSQTQTSVTLKWDAVARATGYDVEADGAVISNGTATSYTHSGLSPETRHTYRVRVTNAGGTGNWSQVSVVNTLPNPPGIPLNLSAVPHLKEILLDWDGVAKADSYDIELDGKVLQLGAETAYSHTGLDPDTAHTYRVRARNTGGVSSWSSVVTLSTLPNPPEAPVKLLAEPSIHEVTLTWEKKERATGYEVEADGIILDNGKETSYVDRDLDALSGHTYRVRAVNAGGKSPWSVPVSITTHPEKPDMPSNVIATSDETSISLTWYKVANTDVYEIEVDGGRVYSAGTTQIEVADLTPDSRHSFRIRAKNISGYSEWSMPVTAVTLPKAEGGNETYSLTNVAAIVTNHDIAISWETVAPDAEYDMEVDGTIQSIGKDTVFHHTGLKANEFHTYKVRFKNGDSAGRWVAVLTLSTLPDPPDAPVEISGTSTNHSIELHWKKVEGATGYDIEIDGKTVSIGADSTYVDENLEPGTSHTYRVRANNMTGVTAWSQALVQSTTNPNYVIDATKDMAFDLTLFAYNVQDFGEKTFVVTFDPDALAIADLIEATPELETSGSGTVTQGLPLTYRVTSGRIEFQVNRNVVPGTSWSGEIATIAFKAVKAGQTSIKVTVE
ncbi:fibronectin type III domain-containing protein [Gorillibacterium massiliense]|uniref:fibronectin type III domain-containing protein n=1 Tax=Gorillibacterium massiliense TaxID=1280390 RepID=UPI0004BC8F5F|nr:hypothetical protein [Gorillibacterium massiliense]